MQQRPVNAPAPRLGPARPTLRSRVRLTLWTVTVVFVVGAVLATVSLRAVVSVRGEIVDRLDPASTATAELDAAVADQEIGVRGYVLTRDEGFLEPYDDGREVADSLLSRLRELLGPTGVGATPLDGVEQLLGSWQESVAEPLVDLADGGGGAVTPTELDTGRAAFETLRLAIGDLARDIDDERDMVRTELDSAARNLTLTLMGLAAVLLTLIVVLWQGLRRLVLDPLAVTVDDGRRIAAGELDHVPSTHGPAELAEVGEALDRVRAGLVAEIREVEARETDLERSNAELEQFAYVASHDLQEPLRKVASFCQMLQRRYRGQLDDRADTYIEFAVDGATRMQDLINDLLAFSRVGRTTERFVRMSGDEVLDAALGNLSTAIEESGTEVRREPLPELVGDRSLLVALFQNLIGNAIKFRSEEPPRVEIGSRTVDGEVRITVADNGIGVPEEYRERIFVIFQRLHGRSDYEGTGIGLALCRKIVEFHGGSIEVLERDAPGTAFRVRLPIDATPRGAESPDPVAAGSTPPGHSEETP